MDKLKFQRLEEEMRQLRLLRMDCNNAKREDEANRIYNDIRRKVEIMITDYDLLKYDPAFTTSSSMYRLDHMFFDLDVIINRIKEELK